MVRVPAPSFRICASVRHSVLAPSGARPHRIAVNKTVSAAVAPAEDAGASAAAVLVDHVAAAEAPAVVDAEALEVLAAARTQNATT